MTDAIDAPFSMKKYAPYVLAAICLGAVYLYFALAKDVKNLPDSRAVVTNHWTGEVKQCIITPDRKWACKPAEPISVPWYMAIVQHTFESLN